MRTENNFSSKYYDSYESHSIMRQKGDKPYLYSYWKRYLKKMKPRGRILDIGCGLGYFLKWMQDLYETYGVDISEYAVSEARKIAVKTDIKISSVADLPFENDFFDIVTAFDVVEHLEDPGLLLKKVHAILRKEGLLIFSTPNPYSVGARIKGKEWHGRRDDTHIGILPNMEWRKLVREYGFIIVRDGTDFLWDTPYLKFIPAKLQWLFFMSLTWTLVWLNGFYPWNFGENYICVAKKT